MTEPTPTDPPDRSEPSQRSSNLPLRREPQDGSKRVIKIGSQRDVPADSLGNTTTVSDGAQDASAAAAEDPATFELPNRSSDDRRLPPEPIESERIETEPANPTTNAPVLASDTATISMADRPRPPTRVSSVSEELRREIEEALGNISMDQLMAGTAAHATRGTEPEIDKSYRAIVVKVHRDDVFLALPGGFDGVLPLRQLVQVPRPGDSLDVVVGSWNREEGLYHLRTSGGSVTVADWSDIEEGIVVEARVTGQNAGGLECEVQQIPAFIPIGQVSLYRVEDLSEYVGKRLPCVVTEANPRRGNLVLSHRAVLEREREASRKQLLEAMAPGQVREGVIRSVRDFGAFVDMGGIDGLIHVSKLSWDRIAHPREVVEEGQRVKVRVEKIDPVTGKISLSYRDMLTDPWENITQRFHEGAIVSGTVTKVMEFGAFVRLDAGVEGLIHISELAHHRVTRVDSVVQIGQEVTVKILAIDVDAQRISLSRKAAITAVRQQAVDELANDSPELEEEPATPATPAVKKQLRGGMDRRTGGDQFGLKW